MLYFHSPDGCLYKLRGSDGSVIWHSLVRVPSTTVNDVYAWSSPTVANGKVIIGISSNCDMPFVQGEVRAYDYATVTVRCSVADVRIASRTAMSATPSAKVAGSGPGGGSAPVIRARKCSASRVYAPRSRPWPIMRS